MPLSNFTLEWSWAEHANHDITKQIKSHWEGGKEGGRDGGGKGGGGGETKTRGVLSSWLSSSPPLHSAQSDGNILGGERLIGTEWKWGRRWESALLPVGRVRERGDDGGQLEALLEMKSAAHKPQLTEEPDGWNISRGRGDASASTAASILSVGGDELRRVDLQPRWAEATTTLTRNAQQTDNRSPQSFS